MQFRADRGRDDFQRSHNTLSVEIFVMLDACAKLLSLEFKVPLRGGKRTVLIYYSKVLLLTQHCAKVLEAEERLGG
jgi:hypothetical protein